MILKGHTAEVARWTDARFGTRIPAGCTVWGVLEAGNLTGSLVFYSLHRGGNIEFGMYGSGAVKRSVFREMGAWVFGELGCTRLTVRTARGNLRARRQLPRAGFTFECTQKRWYGPFPEDDALVFVMFRDQAKRWMH